MKSTKIFFFLVLALVVGFSSCKKEEVSELVKTPEEIQPEIATENPLVYSVKRVASTNTSSANGGLDLECFSIDFPFDLLVDGTTVTINTEDDFNDAINSVTQYLDFAYPLNITYPDGETDVVDDGGALGEIFASCVPSGGWGNQGFPAYLICDLNSCYQLVYPVDLVDGAGNSYTANDETAFVDLIVTYPELYFVFPISLTDNAGETEVANSEDDLYALLADCDDIYNPGDSTLVGDGFACYDLVFPLDLVNTAGENVTANNYDEFYFLVFSGDVVDFAYPFSLIAEDGTTITVNNADELNDALSVCDDNTVMEGIDAFSFILGSSTYGGDCYELVFPFEVANFDGSVTMTVADVAAAEALLNDPTESYFIQLPVSIVLLSNGEVVEITTEQEYFDVTASCGGCPPGTELDAALFILVSSVSGNNCYDLVYPFTVVDATGTTTSIDDAAAAEALINNGTSHYFVQLPVEVILNSTGETVEVTDVGVFFELLSGC